MRIVPEERGLLFFKDSYKKLLMPGVHLIPPGYRVERYPIDRPFIPQTGILSLMVESDPELAAALEITMRPENSLILVFVDGNLDFVFSSDSEAFDTARLCYWKSSIKREYEAVNLADVESASKWYTVLYQRPYRKLLAPYVTETRVESHEKGLLFIDGKFDKILESGLYYFWTSCRSVEVKNADLRWQQAEITGQEIMTSDKVPLRLNFFCQYRIVDPVKALIEIKDSKEQLHVALQIALRDYVGSLLFDDVMAKKQDAGALVTAALKKEAAKFGIELGTAGIKDVILPGEIRDIMNQVLIAEKKAQANVIMRREETASTRSLLNTAKLMEENTVLSRLKEMEYIERIADKIGAITVSPNAQILDELGRLFVPPAQRNPKTIPAGDKK